MKRSSNAKVSFFMPFGRYALSRKGGHMSKISNNVETRDYLAGDVLVEVSKVLPPSEVQKEAAKRTLINMCVKVADVRGDESGKEGLLGHGSL